jgi:hypothetical protein
VDRQCNPVVLARVSLLRPQNEGLYLVVVQEECNVLVARVPRDALDDCVHEFRRACGANAIQRRLVQQGQELLAVRRLLFLQVPGNNQADEVDEGPQGIDILRLQPLA